MAPVNRGKPSIHIPVPHPSTVEHLSGQAQSRTVSGEFLTVPQVNSLYTGSPLFFAKYTAISSNFIAFFAKGTASEGTKVTQKEKLDIVSFNCKNVNTCNYVLNELLVDQSADILFLQEHWLFDCQLHRLSEISDLCTGSGKAVDTDDPILLVQMPRGYGGIAVSWIKENDHLITQRPDGGNCIQCVEVKGAEAFLLLSVYMQCKGITDNTTEFMEVIDQLWDILHRYSATHKVIIGGDMNEDLTSSVSSPRMRYLQEFISEHKLHMKLTKPTFISQGGGSLNN